MQTDKILKVFITHQDNLQATLDKVSYAFVKDYIVVAGGYATDSYEGSVIKLNCDDSYCGLPDKITSLFKFISENPAFDSYTHFHKLDEDMTLIKEIDFELTDYMGMVAGKHTINRNHHIGRCEGHYWNDKPYEGEISDWCEGGLSYIVSRKAIECIAQADGKQYPLEDVMVANILENNGIYPKFTNMNQYYKPNQWYNPIRTYQDFKGKEWREDGIPKWIFRTGPMSEDALPNVMKLIYYDMMEKNPGYQLFYFSDADCENYIRDYYGEEYLATYNSLVPTAYKADFWRYLILRRHGGCYNDFSQVILVPFDEIIENMDRVFAVDTPEAPNALYNAFMCSKAGDAIVKRAIELSKHNIDNKLYGFNTLDVTGPRVLGRAFCEIVYNNPKSPIYIGVSGKTKTLDNIEMMGMFIVDKRKKPLIVKKLNNHFSIIYHNRNMPHYGQLWHERKVFK
jgi:hypothetical protein